MGSLLVVDGSDICRAPIVAFALQEALREAGWLERVQIRSRGTTAVAGGTMCESAATRIGFSGRAIGFFVAHRSTPLSPADLGAADLVLTAEREQRSAAVRMRPGIQPIVFTWKEALGLAGVLADRRRIDGSDAVTDLPALARALHGARGTVPMLEPTVRTGVFHWRRHADRDPLTIGSGHDGRSEHRLVTKTSADVAAALGATLARLAGTRTPEADLGPRLTAPQRLRRTA